MKFINAKAASLKQGAIRAMFDRAAAMKDAISMGIGEPDMATPASICQAASRALEQGDTHYTPNAGTLQLRTAVASYLAKKGLSYDPVSEIVITNGGMGSLALLFLVILNPGDEILIQDPQWLNYVAQVEYCGGKAVRVPTDAEHNFEMQPEVIESLITPATKALMINSPNNPTGHIMSKETMEKIAQIAKKHDLLVISDEVYSTLLYDDASFHSIAELEGMKEYTVVINSFSKAFAMCGWRIGYTAGPSSIITAMTRCQENINACANSFGQAAAAYALDHMEESEKLCEIFARRRELLMDGLSKIDGIRFKKPEGAFYIFADISSFGMSSKEFCDRLLEEQHVVCIPGSAFGSCGEGFIRIAYTCSDEALAEAIERIKAFCDGISA